MHQELSGVRHDVLCAERAPISGSPHELHMITRRGVLVEH